MIKIIIKCQFIMLGIKKVLSKFKDYKGNFKFLGKKTFFKFND